MILTADETDAIISLFESEPYGKKALEILRRESGYDTRTNFIPDARRQDYNLGRASLFSDIIKTIKKGRDNAKSRRRQPKPEF